MKGSDAMGKHRILLESRIDSIEQKVKAMQHVELFPW
jgi:hypothetical protein